MRTIAFWSPKGGVGKTTLAINVAAAAHYDGKKVILCDMDPQFSAADVFNDQQLPYSVFRGYPDVTPRVDIMVLDFPPRVDIALTGDVIVVPMRACILDMRAVNKAIRYVYDRQIVKCVNAVDTRRHDERLLAMKLYAEGARLIKDRSVYSRAISA